MGETFCSAKPRLRRLRLKSPNEALPQTDEVYAEDGALIFLRTGSIDSAQVAAPPAASVSAA